MFITLFYLEIGTFPYGLQGKVSSFLYMFNIMYECLYTTNDDLDLACSLVVWARASIVHITNLTGHFPSYRSQGQTCFYANFRLAAS